MKKAQLIELVRKSAERNTQTLSHLALGDIVEWQKAEALVVMVDESRAALWPLDGSSNDLDSISPNSELPVLRRVDLAGCIALIEGGKRTPRTARTGTSEPAAPKLGKLGGYLGQTVVSVIRTLGRDGWSFADTRAAFDRVGVDAADQTLRIQLKAGKDGKGSYAEISKKDLAVLKGKQPKVKAAPAPAVEAVPQPA